MKKQFNKINLPENLSEILPIRVSFDNDKKNYDFSQYKVDSVSKIFAKAFYDNSVNCTSSSRGTIYEAVKKFLNFLEQFEINRIEDLQPQIFISYASFLDSSAIALSTKYKSYNKIESIIKIINKVKKINILVPKNPFTNVHSERKPPNKLTSEQINRLLKTCYKEIDDSYAFFRNTQYGLEELNNNKFDENSIYKEKKLINIIYYFYKNYGYVPSYDDLTNKERHFIEIAGGIDNILKGISPSSNVLLPYYIVLLVELAANPESIRNIKFDCIREDILFDDRCFIFWNKNRANSEQKRNVLKKKKYGAFQIIEMVKYITYNLRPIMPKEEYKNYLFICRGGTKKGILSQVSQWGFSSIIKDFIKRNNLDFDFTLDMIRPSVLTEVYRTRKDIVSVFKIANHKSINTTLLYVVDDEIKKENRQYISEKQNKIIEDIFLEKNNSFERSKELSINAENMGFTCSNPIVDKKVCTNWMTELTNPSLIIPNDVKYISRIIALKNEINKNQYLIDKERFHLLYTPILSVINEQILPRFTKSVLKEAETIAKNMIIPMIGLD